MAVAPNAPGGPGAGEAGCAAIGGGAAPGAACWPGIAIIIIGCENAGEDA